jgi:hypothetical protein
MEANQDICMKFFYHMYGSDVGELNIYRGQSTAQEKEKRLWTAKRINDNKWYDAAVSIRGTSKYTVSYYLIVI